MPLEVKKALESLGLRPKEIQVLLVLLEHGPMLVAALAKAAKLNRTTTYGILKDLAESGLVTSAKHGSSLRYQSISPELLPAYIERRGKELIETKESLEKLIPQIKLLRSKAKALPKVQFFEGTEGIKQAFEDKLANNEGKVLYEFTGMDAGYAKMDHAFIDYYLNKRAKLRIFSTYISPDTPLSRKTAEDDDRLYRKVKFIPEKYAIATEVSIYDNKVSISSFSPENPVAVLIEDENIAQTMKQLFNFIESKLP